MKIHIQGFGYLAQLFINCALIIINPIQSVLCLFQITNMPVSGLYKGPN